MRRWLEERGYRVLAVDLKPSNGSVGLDKLAEQLREFVECELTPAGPFDLVGFSMGGLVSRYCAATGRRGSSTEVNYDFFSASGIVLGVYNRERGVAADAARK
jgi:pimeloyl-ACP methyl ester carboxylesterase